MSDLPPLPQGFTLDEPQAAGAAPPPPPPGFTLDNPEMAPQPQRSGLERMAGGLVSELTAAGQGVSPVIATQQPIGSVVQMASGERGVKDPQGRITYFDPSTQVIMNDPDSGQAMVYARTPEMEAGPIESFGRMVGMGAVAPSTAPRAAVQGPLTQTARRAQEFREAGVTPTMGDITQSGALQRAEAALANLPTGQPLRARTAQQAQEGAEQLAEITRRYGQALPEEPLGAQVRAGMQRFTGERLPVPATEAIKAPARATTFPTKAGALYDRVDDLIPPETPVTLRSTRDMLSGTREGLEGMEDIADLLDSPTLKRWRTALENREGLTYDTLKRVRTAVGNLINWKTPVDDEANASLKRLWGSLTDDMGEAAQAAGPEAVRAWDQARRFYAGGREMIRQRIEPLLRTQRDESIAQRINNAAKARGGNAAELRTLKQSLRPEEWGDVSASVLERMGQPRGGAPKAIQDIGFNPADFVTNWNNLSDRAKSLLFGTGPQRRNLDRLARVMESAKEKERFVNFSNSWTQPGALGQLVGAGFFAGTGDLLGLIAGVAGPYGASKILANPQALRWVLRYPTSTTKVGQIAQLSQIARRNPAIASDLRAIQEQLSALVGSTAGEGR